MQITPDGDYTQTGVEWNKVGYGSRQHAQYVTAPERSGLYYFHARTDSGPVLRLPLDRGARLAAEPRRRAGLEHHLERLQQFRRAEQLHPRRPTAADAHGQRPARAAALQRSRVRHLERRGLCAAVVRPARADQPHARGERARPTRSKAAPPATSRRPSGGCWAGWSARASTTTSTPRPNCTPASSTSIGYRVLVISTHPEYWSRTMYQRGEDAGSSSGAAG